MIPLLSPPRLHKFIAHTNYLYPENGPSVEDCKASIDADVITTNRFHELRFRQDAHERRELMELSKQLGKIVMAPLYKKIGKSTAEGVGMSSSEGKNWPSLAYDFGVSHKKDPTTGSILEEMEFKKDWTNEKSTDFKGILHFSAHFDTLGVDVAVLKDALVKMRQVELDMYDSMLNPYPSFIYGRKALDKSNQEREAAAVMARNSFVFNFNDMTKDDEVYLKIRFEGKTGPKDLNQNIVFTFPTLNEQREIWQHVFWGYDYPLNGIPIDTDYAQKQAFCHNRME